MCISEINNITVIGAGNMGHQIATLCAIQGYNTICTDIDENNLKKADDFVDRYLNGRVEKCKLSDKQAKESRNKIRFTPDLQASLKNSDFVIEAIVESVNIKIDVFSKLDKYAPKHAILSTNSSAIVSSKLAEYTNRPEKVLNMHFFNPALVMKLVEIVQGPHVANNTFQVTYELCKSLGKIPIHIKKEVKGFVLNRIIKAIQSEALWMLEMDVASFEDIDKACVHGAGHPMGPFRLCDLTGIDLAYTLAMETFKETGDPADFPAPKLVEHFAKGEYGEKTGKGWYKY
ncbi:MAG: 3-hydroxyacyl-CoA dehydrogenase family protein [Desulfovermiculus sp.]|nr:3-hydroxyacyl-CoA dehydrogenase family protein [Desulfovermiculus sp.]